MHLSCFFPEATSVHLSTLLSATPTSATHLLTLCQLQSLADHLPHHVPTIYTPVPYSSFVTFHKGNSSIPPLFLTLSVPDLPVPGLLPAWKDFHQTCNPVTNPACSEPACRLPISFMDGFLFWSLTFACPEMSLLVLACLFIVYSVFSLSTTRY